MKRVALCFSGQLRNVAKGFEYINKNLIGPNCWEYEFDTFVHTWFEQEHVGKALTTAKGVATSSGEVGCSEIPNNILNSVYELYDPKKMLLEKQINFDEKDYNIRKSSFIIPRFTLSKMSSMQKVCKLKTSYESENDFTYDLVVSLRFDLGIQSEIILSGFENNFVNVSTHGVSDNVGIDVSHGIMPSKMFDKYTQLIDCVDDYWRNMNVEFCDERLTHKHFDVKNIPYIRSNSLNNYILIRN